MGHFAMLAFFLCVHYKSLPNRDLPISKYSWYCSTSVFM